MPNRIIKETICTSDNLDRLSAFQETVFYRLLVNCDDFGRMDARPKILASKLFPLKDIRVNQIEDALRALTSAELVILYEVDGKPFLQMKTWDQHQQIRAKRSRYPGPNGSMISNDIKCNQMISDDIKCSRNPIQSESESESESESNHNPKRGRGGFKKPSLAEVEEYCGELMSVVNPDEFMNHYDANGWMIGPNPMRDWKAALRNWDQKRRAAVGLSELPL